MEISKQYKWFLLLAIICCFLSVITTIGIHSSLFDLGNLTFDERVRLFENPKYLAKRFWVIAHCLFVLISMLGFLLIQFKKSPGFTILGLIGYIVFSFAEIFRQIFILFTVNNLRKSYVEANGMELQEIFQSNMDFAGFIAFALFGLFILGFAFGNINYGISLLGGSKLDHILSCLFLIWGIKGMLVFGNQFWKYESIGQIIGYSNTVFQPAVRASIGFWLLYRYRNIIKK